MHRFLNVWDRLARCCTSKRLRFDEDVGDDQHTERGRALLRQEQVRLLRQCCCPQLGLGLCSKPQLVRSMLSRSGYLFS